MKHDLNLEPHPHLWKEIPSNQHGLSNKLSLFMNEEWRWSIFLHISIFSTQLSQILEISALFSLLMNASKFIK